MGTSVLPLFPEFTSCLNHKLVPTHLKCEFSGPSCNRPPIDGPSPRNPMLISHCPSVSRDTWKAIVMPIHAKWSSDCGSWQIDLRDARRNRLIRMFAARDGRTRVVCCLNDRLERWSGAGNSRFDNTVGIHPDAKFADEIEKNSIPHRPGCRFVTLADCPDITTRTRRYSDSVPDRPHSAAGTPGIAVCFQNQPPGQQGTLEHWSPGVQNLQASARMSTLSDRLQFIISPYLPECAAHRSCGSCVSSGFREMPNRLS
jgi:hypothetical protein